MSRPSFDVEEQYTGNNVTDTFSFDFKITSETQLEVIVMNASGVELERGYGSANSYVDTVTIDGDNGGEVLLNAPLPTNYKLILLLADDEPVQSSEFRNKFDFTLKRLEDALDRVAGAVQRLAYIGKRALRIHETDDETAISTVFPPGFAAAADRAIIVNEDGDGIDYGPTSDEIENAQSYALAAAASAVDADNSADAALASEGLAEDWATKTSATVDGSEYSSKEYAIGVQRRGLANGGSAKDWANYTGGTVDDTEFSAKKYAQDAATSAASMAQRDLSNLTSPTAVNQDILPDAAATRSIGSAAAYWLNMVAQFFIVPSGVSGRFGTANRTDGATSNDSIFRSGNVSGTLSGVQTGNNTSKSGDILTDSTGTGDTGFNAVTSGAISAVGVTGATGDVQTSSGNNAGTGKTGDRYDSTGDAAGGNSGDIYRYTGQGSANSGSIEDTTGDAAAGDSGDIKHTTGSASGVRGAIIQSARLLRIPIATSDPTTPVQGAIYYDTVNNKIRHYTGSAWEDVRQFPVATQSDQETGTSTTVGVTPGRQQYHPSAAKAWGRWQSSSLTRGYNISSITDNSNADQTINYTTAFSANDQTFVGGSGFNSTSLRCVVQPYNATDSATGSMRLQAVSTDGLLASACRMYAVWFGDQ